jgi:hypothetical protein
MDAEALKEILPELAPLLAQISVIAGAENAQSRDEQYNTLSAMLTGITGKDYSAGSSQERESTSQSKSTPVTLEMDQVSSAVSTPSGQAPGGRKKETKQEKKDRKKLARKKAKVDRKAKDSSDYFGRPSQAMTVFGSMKSVPLPKELLEEDQACSTCRRSALETEHVQKVYDTIADQWHGTRYKSWPKVAEFISKQPMCSLVGDLGCGNGKNIPACNNVSSLPLPVCMELLCVTPDALTLMHFVR